MRAMRRFPEERGTSLLDTGAPFYDVYETADQEWVSVGSIEPQFYEQLVELTGIDSTDLPDQMDRNGWPLLRKLLTAVFKSKTRAEWATIFEGSDACFAPVLPMGEAGESIHTWRPEEPSCGTTHR